MLTIVRETQIQLIEKNKQTNKKNNDKPKNKQIKSSFSMIITSLKEKYIIF